MKTKFKKGDKIKFSNRYVRTFKDGASKRSLISMRGIVLGKSELPGMINTKWKAMHTPVLSYYPSQLTKID
jgi:hypothetical protein